MKNGKRLTKKLKIFLVSNNLNPNDWLYVKNTPKELHIVNKLDNSIKILNKE
nr:hypothetical protein [uncultured Tyzzerella sp.]